MKFMSNGGLFHVKWWEDSISGHGIQIGQHLTPFLTKKAVENRDTFKNPYNIPIFDSFFFVPKGGQMLSDLNSAARFEILSSFSIGIIGPHLTCFSYFHFLTSPAFSKNWNHMRGRKIFKLWNFQKLIVFSIKKT